MPRGAPVPDVLRVGTKLYGYCGGEFGNLYSRDAHHVEAVGADWVVIRTANGDARFTTGVVPEDLLRFAAPEDDDG